MVRCTDAVPLLPTICGPRASDAGGLVPEDVIYSDSRYSEFLFRFPLRRFSWSTSSLRLDHRKRQRRSAPSPPCGGGVGRGVVVVARDISANIYPHPQPLPQGGGERTEYVATFVHRAIAPSSKRVKSSLSEHVRMI